MINGIILVDKPEGFTSHDVVAKSRGILRMKKIGHAGTLDPMATGVLPLFLGYATKACDRMPNQDKAYMATLKLGISTDTQDITGEVIKTEEVSVSAEQFESVLNNFLGTTSQLPPMYSAVQVDGRRLYDLARQGIEVERTPRDITVYNIDLINSDEIDNEYTFEISCSKGTYIRTICHDIGEKLGCGAVLTKLRRTMSSGFKESECVTLDRLQQIADAGELEEHILPVDMVFESYEKVILNKELTKHFFNGVPLWLRQLEIEPNDQMIKLYDEFGEFLGVAKANKIKGQLSDQKQFTGRLPFEDNSIT